MSDIAINPVTRRVQFTGNTGTGPYAFTFNVLQSSDIVVYKNNVLLTETTDYTVSIAANGTGNITMVVALVLTDILTIIGGRELSRTTDFVTAGDLLASSLNEQLDSNVIMSQQLDERFGRTLAVPPGDEDKTLDLPLAADRADKIILFDESGNVTAAAPSDFFGNAVLGGNFIVNTATGNGSQTAFGLTVAPGIKTNIQIHIDGVYQNKATFSLSGSTVTFTEAPPLNAAIEFMMGESVTQITGDASAITYNQGGTGAQDRTVRGKLQETVSVKDFGAVGDGVTDDTAAIDVAISYVALAGGGTVFFPTGTYITDGIGRSSANQHGVTLLGEGIGGTTIKNSGAGNTHTIRILGCRNFVVKSLTVDDNNVSGTAGGIRVIGSYHCIIDTVKVINGYHMSIEITGTVGDSSELSDADEKGVGNKALNCIVENQKRWSAGVSKAQILVDSSAIATVIDNCESINNITISDAFGPDLMGNDEGYGTRFSNCRIRGLEYSVGAQQKTAFNQEGTVNVTPGTPNATNFNCAITNCYIENIANGLSITQNSSIMLDNLIFKNIWGEYSITNSAHELIANNLIFDGCYRRAGVNTSTFNRDGGIFTSAGTFSNVRFINCDGSNRYNVNVVGGGSRVYENTNFVLDNAFLEGRVYVSGAPAANIELSRCHFKQRAAATPSVVIEGINYTALTDPEVHTVISDCIFYNEAVVANSNHHVVIVDSCRFRASGGFMNYGIQLNGTSIASVASNNIYASAYTALVDNNTTPATTSSDNVSL